MTDDDDNRGFSGIPENEEAALGAISLAYAASLSPESVLGVLAVFDAYRAMVSCLLGEPGQAVEYLRGLAGIALQDPPDPDDAFGTTTVRRLNETLKRVGAEPFTMAEITAHMRAAAQTAMYGSMERGQPS